MYGMILLDDEPIVLKGIQKVFNMSDYGFEIKGAFMNPLKALEVLPVIQPKLIITDVKMPQMTGLEFAAKARELLPDVEIVILSGYDDFSYAQTALKLGVSDYMLKPIKKASFAEMMTKMRAKIMEKEAETAYYKELQLFAESNQIELVNRFLLNLIEEGLRDENYAHTFCEKMNLPIENEAFILIKLFVGAKQQWDVTSGIGLVLSELEKVLEPFGDVRTVIGDAEDMYVILYGDDCSTNIDEITDLVKDYVSHSEENRLQLSAGISGVMFGIGMLYLARYECENNKMEGSSAVSQEVSEVFELSKDMEIPYDKMEAFYTEIERHSEQGVLDKINAIYPESEDMRYLDYATSITYLMLLRTNTLLGRAGAEQVQMPDIVSLRTGYQNIASQKELVLTAAKALMEETPQKKETVSSKIVSDAITYIQNNYTSNISLGDVADNIAINKNYLCEIFRKELNVTFVSYVTNLRIEKAKDLLVNTDMRMYEIADEVGFSDYPYFSQIFKRYTGYTLSSYKKEYSASSNHR